MGYRYGKFCEQADGPHTKYRSFQKRRKNRIERRRAKQNAECTPLYGKYRGYVS